jgi:hypothetical protein
LFLALTQSFSEALVLKTVLLTVLAIVAAALIYAATKPDNFRIERSATIKPPPE